MTRLHFAKAALWLAALAIVGCGGAAAATDVSDMKHYENTKWRFELDIPKSWHAFPPVPTNGHELIRFESVEGGTHVLIVFRDPRDPPESLTAFAADMQKLLTKAGFGHFVTGETTIGSQKIVTLDYDMHNANGSTWSCRAYFLIEGRSVYTLGFGTSNRDAMFPVYDKMAKTFVSREPST